MIDRFMEFKRALSDRAAAESIGKPWNLLDGVAIAVDAKPPAAPAFQESDLCSWPMTTIQPDAGELAMSSLVASFYEGVSFQTGKAREDRWRLERAMHG